MSIPRRRLGRTELMVSTLGYGSMGLRGPRTWGQRVVDDDQAERILNAVLDAGINFIDTAPDYGLAEQRIGKFIGSRQHDFMIATKCGCTPVQHADELEIRHTWTPAVLRANIEESLRRLRRECIDVLQLHGGAATQAVGGGLIEEMQALQRAGKVRYIGVSSSLPELDGFAGLPDLDVFQVPYSCLNAEHARVAASLAETDRGVIVRGGIARGGPEAEIQRHELNAVWESAKLDELLPPGMLKAEFILRCTLSQRWCHTTIVGTANLDHLQANTNAAELGPLASDVVDEVERRVGAA